MEASEAPSARRRRTPPHQSVLADALYFAGVLTLSTACVHASVERNGNSFLVSTANLYLDLLAGTAGRASGQTDPRKGRARIPRPVRTAARRSWY